VDVLRIPLLVSGLSIVLAVSGCALFQYSHADLEKDVHSRVGVQEHELVDTYYSKAAVSVYVGQWVDDPVGLVTVPGATFRKPEYSLSNEIFDDLAQADYVVEQGKQCHTDVVRLRRGKDPQEDWPLSTEQRDGARAGSLEVLKIVTVCGGND
jgi:hypothetical protein